MTGQGRSWVHVANWTLPGVTLRNVTLHNSGDDDDNHSDEMAQDALPVRALDKGTKVTG